MQKVIAAVDTISESLLNGMTLGDPPTVISVAGKIDVSVQIATAEQMMNMTVTNSIASFILDQFDTSGSSCFKNKVRPIMFIGHFVSWYRYM